MREAGARVRPAAPADAAAIADLRVAAWQAAYAEILPADYLASMRVTDEEVARRRRRLAAPPAGGGELVAVSDGKVVGWLVAGPSRDDDADPARTGEVYACYVRPAAWGRGVGRVLLDAGLAVLGEHGYRRVTLWVLADNARARRFYRGAGLHPDGASKPIELGVEVLEVRHAGPLLGGPGAARDTDPAGCRGGHQMADVSVRPARPADAAAIADVQVRTWRSAYDGILPRAALDALTLADARQRWETAVSEPPSPRHHVVVAMEADRVVGLAAFGPAEDPEPDPRTTAEIYTLLVDPVANRRGHGSRLLAAAVDGLRGGGFRTAVVWLFEADGGCHAFYESAGWALDGASRDLDMGQLVHQLRLHTDLSEQPDDAGPG